MDQDIKNLTVSIAEELKEDQLEIHIKIQQRNGRKCITFVEGLIGVEKIDKHKDKFMEEMSKKFRKTFNCAATLKKPENIIQLQGDQRYKIKDYLVNQKIVNADKIKIHGC